MSNHAVPRELSSESVHSQQGSAVRGRIRPAVETVDRTLESDDDRYHMRTPSNTSQAGREESVMRKAAIASDRVLPGQDHSQNSFPDALRHGQHRPVISNKSRGSSSGSTVRDDRNRIQQYDNIPADWERNRAFEQGDRVATIPGMPSYLSSIANDQLIPSDTCAPVVKNNGAKRDIQRSPPVGVENVAVSERLPIREENTAFVQQRPVSENANKSTDKHYRIRSTEQQGRSRGSSIGSISGENRNASSSRPPVAEGRRRSSRNLIKNVDELPADRMDGYLLIAAAAQGEVERVRSILYRNPSVVNFANYDKRTALHLAAAEDYKHVVQELLKHGASMGSLDRSNRTPVQEAILWGRIRTLRVFARHNAPFPPNVESLMIDANYWRGRDLLEAAATGRLKAVEQLVMIFKSNLNWQNADGRTALHLACANRRRDVVKFLLLCGADAHRRDRRGTTPADEAKSCGDPELYSMFQKEKGNGPEVEGRPENMHMPEFTRGKHGERGPGFQPEIRIIT